jgi:hypothetical protein
MEWLLTLLPVGLVVLVCGGMHMLMMRGMHGGHDAAPGHGGHLSATDPEDDARPERPIKLVRRSGQGDASEMNRIAELENQVASLQEEIDAMLTYPRRSGNGSNFGRVAAPHHRDVVWQNESPTDASQGDFDDDGNE